MKLGYDLTLEQVQKLVMTPELRQAIELLQFTSLELNEYLEQQIEENPLLELNSIPEDHENIDDYAKEKDEIDWKEFIDKSENTSYRPERNRNIKEYNYENFITYSPSLKDNLLFQLNVLDISNKDKKIGEILIEYIDENGYLITTTEQISSYLEIDINRVEKVLSLIQKFEPLGVGARDLRECLLIQIKRDKDKNPNVEKVIENHLEDIARNRLSKISRELDIDIIEIQNICDYIKTLEPKPGRAFSGSGDQVKYIVPDATIEYIDGEYIILLNDITGPRININSFYKDMMIQNKDPNATEYLTGKLNSAMWIIRSIEQRRMTIYKVIESILKFQKDFFEMGEKGLKPLTLKEIAEDIDMHESTVSRATNGKYVQTPRGIFELKFFFSSGLTTNQGDMSSTSIKSMLKDIVENENPKAPLSDQKIADILKNKGISISRRTVAKYRDELEIPASNLRKRY